MCLTHRLRSSALGLVEFCSDAQQRQEGSGQPEAARAGASLGLAEYFLASSELRSIQRPPHHFVHVPTGPCNDNRLVSFLLLAAFLGLLLVKSDNAPVVCKASGLKLFPRLECA